jgi:hypothetical protein
MWSTSSTSTPSIAAVDWALSYLLPLPGSCPLTRIGCIEHFVANERAGAFYEREGSSVERIESGPTEDPALGIVWRARHLAPFEPTSGQA